LLNIGTTELILVIAVFFLVALPVIIIIIFAWRANGNRRTSDENLKQCPFCAEKIQAQAIICRFCGKDLSA